MTRIFLTIAFLSHLIVFAQTSEKYNSDYVDYYRAEELFQKEQYGAARMEFRKFMDSYRKSEDPMFLKASYYEAISALELYNNDAVGLLEQFNKDYPESIYRKDIYFRLGKFYYYKKDYEDALVWFNQLSSQDIEEEDREEFYFKIGYSNFKLEHFETARDAFYEAKDGATQYAKPSLYYYSHIAYQSQKYETALEGFLKLEDDEKFGNVVAYYIAQIYYLQGKYELVTQYATRVTAEGNVVNENDMNHLIGDAYYRIGKFEEAVPYLEQYNKSSKTTRDEDYSLGYAYYKSGKYDKAIRLFDNVTNEEDSLTQVAFYHIGECQIKLDNKVSARSAFQQASRIDADPIVQEDALYNFAILSYKLDINPYDEAVEAFEQYLTAYPNSDRREDVYQYLVNVYTSTNNYEKALASLDKLPNKDIKLKSAYQLIAFNQGVGRFQKSDYTGAISSFKLVEKYPIDPAISGKALYWTADANYRLKKYDEAISGFKASLASPSQSSELKAQANYNIGYSYLEKKDLSKAIDAFRNYTQSLEAKGQKKADAYLRIADSYYSSKQNELAVEFYKKTISMNEGYEDRALFYMAKTYGYMNGKLDDKISNLLDIINNYKQSSYMQEAIYEVAISYKSDGRFNQAMKYFKMIVADYPTSSLVVDARLSLADIYGKQGNIAKAEEEYRAILTESGSDQEICKLAAQGLIDLYTINAQPEKIEQLATQYACVQIDPSEQENLYFGPALEAYNDSTKSEKIRLPDAISRFEKYLEKFPNGRYENESKNYIADAHFRLGNVDQAMTIYAEVLQGPNNTFTELAAERASKYAFNNGDYQNAINYYKKLEQISSAAEVIFNSQVGLMRSYFLVENWTNSSLYAGKVLSSSKINSEIKVEAYYAQGMSNFYLKDYLKALPALEWLDKNNTTFRGAEAKYTIAEIYYSQMDYVKTESEITALLKRKPADNYWIAKGLILRTRAYMVQDRLVEAEQTLKSVREHYKVPDDGIKTEADALWNELMQLKDAPKNITPPTNPIININGQ